MSHTDTKTPAGPESPPRWTRRPRRKVLGVVMIVRNELQNLQRLFPTLQEVADELVVVDTGSTDGTLALLRAWGAITVHEPWRDDFARARNRGLAAATAPYLLRLDADEELPPETQAGLIRLREEQLVRGPARAFDLEVHNSTEIGLDSRHLETRIFPNHPGVRFRGRIHEEIVTSLRTHGIEGTRTNLTVRHWGYASAREVEAKNARNLALLRAAVEQDPEDVHALVHLAQARAGGGEPGEAEEFLARAIRLLAERASAPLLRAELHVLRATYRSVLGNRVGLLHDLERARALYPAWAMPEAIEAEQRVMAAEWDALEVVLHRAQGKSFTSGTIAFAIRRAESNMALFQGYLQQRKGDEEGARAGFHAALEADGVNLNARLALGQLLLDAEEFAAAREVLEPAGEDPAAVARFVEVATAIALARTATGDEDGAAACLAPLLDIFEEGLLGADEVDPLQLAEAALRAGHPHAARNLLALHQHSLRELLPG